MSNLKNVPPHLAEKSGKCIFCGKPGRSRTHIWPDWLHRLLGGVERTIELESHDHMPGRKPVPSMTAKRKQGGLFSQKPFLACVQCNTGWMREFEDNIVCFAKPIFSGTQTVELSAKQISHLANWVGLVTILAEFINRGDPPAIPVRHRAHLKVRGHLPSDEWTIVAAAQNGKDWYAKHRSHRAHLGQYTSLAQFHGTVLAKPPPNTLLSSFGMGRLFAQSFVCPDPRFVGYFRTAAKESGFIQLWPVHSSIWPFPKRTAHFPGELVLSDEGAKEAANSFAKRINAMTVTPDKIR